MDSDLHNMADFIAEPKITLYMQMTYHFSKFLAFVEDPVDSHTSNVNKV